VEVRAVTRAARFSQADLTRAVAAVRKAGETVAGAKIQPDGTIVILTAAVEAANDINPLDRVLGR
jgi:hypothetical protein